MLLHVLRVVSALGLLLILVACDAPAAKPEAGARPLPVAVAPVVQAPRAGMVKGTGMVAYKREVPLSFKVAGRIASFTVDSADRVAAGQPLAVLDPAEVGAQLREADAAVAKAQQDLARVEPLAEKGFVQRARVDDARTALKAAEARRDAVAFNRRLAEIKAPSDGVILVRHLEPGEIVAAGTPVLTLGDGNSGLIARVGLADRDAGRISLGAAAEVTVDGKPVAATVTRISSKSDPRTGVFEVELKLDNPPPRLASGRVVAVRIQPDADATAALLAIPSSALIEGFGDEASVFVVDPATRKVDRRLIRVSGLEAGDTLVLSGLAAGDLVVSRGAAYLRAGDLIEPVAAALAPAAAPAAPGR